MIGLRESWDELSQGRGKVAETEQRCESAGLWDVMVSVHGCIVRRYGTSPRTPKRRKMGTKDKLLTGMEGVSPSQPTVESVASSPSEVQSGDRAENQFWCI